MDAEIKPKINAMLSNIGATGSAEEATSLSAPQSNKYEFRDLKRDLETIHADFAETYPE